MFNYYLELVNTPPRTQVPKHLYVGNNHSDGNMTITLTGAWSEYKPEEVQQISDAIQKWLADLTPWLCRFCGEVGQTVPPDLNQQYYGYKWLRCRHCKKKTPLDKVEWMQ